MINVLLIAGMAAVALLAVLLMKKIAPEDKVYPVWALFIVILFALVVIFTG